MDFKDVVYENMDVSHLAQNKVWLWADVNLLMNHFGFIKGGELLDWPVIWWLLKERFAYMEIVSEWVSEWMNEWMTEWMNEWMNEWVSEPSSQPSSQLGSQLGSY
jgi:hypothetical protein